MAAVIEKDGTTLNVRLDERLDTTQAPVLEKELVPHLEGVNQIVMDFSEVDYISSSGLRLLMYLSREMDDRDGEVQIIHANEVVMKIFELVGFTGIVHIIED